MHFLDAWSRLAPQELARLIIPIVALTLAILLPGRRVAALAAMLVALATPVLTDLGGMPLRLAWGVLWVLIAVRIYTTERETAPDPTARPGGVESGTVGLLLGLALFVLLVAAIARQDLEPTRGRAVSYAAALMLLGLLHLMLRRHLRRAMLAFASLGLGVQLLDRAAREAQLPGEGKDAAAILLATALAVALSERLAAARLSAGGGIWVSQAHDLHD